MSEVAIANLTLTHLGQKSIVSLDEDSKSARTLKRVWALLRDEVLRLHTWNFAKVKAVLPRLQKTPAWGYAYAYKLPTDCLRLIQVGEDEDIDIAYELVGREIHMDDEVCKIAYISRVEDTDMYDALFTAVFAARLAVAAAIPLTASGTILSNMQALFKAELDIARAANGAETAPQEIPASTLLASRQ